MIKSHFFSIGFFVYLCSMAYGEPAVYTSEELLTMVKAQKSKIESIEYAFSYTLSTDHISDDKEKRIITSLGVVGLEYIEVGQEGHKKYMNHRFHNDPKATLGFGEQRLTFDGKVGTSYFPKEAEAEIKPDIYSKLHTNDHFYTAMLMHEPTGTDITTVMSENSLVSILGSDLATVRPETEKIDGYDCHVVDIKKRGEVLRTVYIDPQRGSLPVKSVKYRITEEGKQEVISECHLSNIRDFGGDLWFPLQADRMIKVRRGSNTGAEEAEPATLKYVLKIQKDENGKPLLQVNHDISDDKFKGNFAIRTHVYDRVVNSFYLVGSTSASDLDQFTTDRIELAKEDNLPLDQFAKQYDERHTDRDAIVNGNVRKETDDEVSKTVKSDANNTHIIVIGITILVIVAIVVIIKKKGGIKQ